MIDNPQVSFPFRLNSTGTDCVAVEQDSDDEVQDNMEVILRTPLGSREEVPDFGLDDQTFKMNGVDPTRILDVIDLWEPRARLVVTKGPGLIETMIDHVRIKNNETEGV